MRPETRGFVFGLSLGLAALAGFGAAQLDSRDGGRYQVAASESPAVARVYLLDTQRGRV